MNAANIEVVGREKYARPTVWSRDVSPTNQFADNRFADKTFHWQLAGWMHCRRSCISCHLVSESSRQRNVVSELVVRKMVRQAAAVSQSENERTWHSLPHVPHESLLRFGKTKERLYTYLSFFNSRHLNSGKWSDTHLHRFLMLRIFLRSPAPLTKLIWSHIFLVLYFQPLNFGPYAVKMSHTVRSTCVVYTVVRVKDRLLIKTSQTKKGWIVEKIIVELMSYELLSLLASLRLNGSNQRQS